MSHPFDATLKEIVRQHEPDYAPAFGLPTHLPATGLNVDLSTVSAATDVAFGFGDPIQEIADLNFQSGPDVDVVPRVQFYGAAYHLRFGVPVRTLLILLRPAADHAGLTGQLSYSAGATQLQFQCEVMRLWQRPVEPFLTGGVGLLPLAPLCQAPAGVSLEDWMKQVVHEVDRRLATEAPYAQAVRLMTATFVLTGLRVPKSDLDDIYRGVRVMHDSSAFELIEERAHLAGQIREAQRMLFRQGRTRLGPPDPTTEAALAAIRDLDRLERMGDAMLVASDWATLLNTP